MRCFGFYKIEEASYVMQRGCVAIVLPAQLSTHVMCYHVFITAKGDEEKNLTVTAPS